MSRSTDEIGTVTIRDYLACKSMTSFAAILKELDLPYWQWL